MNGLVSGKKGSLMAGGRLPRGKTGEFDLQEGSGEDQMEAEGGQGEESRGQERTPGNEQQI